MVNQFSERLQGTASLPFSLNLAQELLAIYGSPLYVYDGDRLRQTICDITRSIPYPFTQFQFASVTNGNLCLLQIFREAGWGLHANTPGDIYLGLHARFHPNQIVYSGSNLNRADMEQILSWKVGTLNLDSLCQLQRLCEVYGQVRSQESAPLVTLQTQKPEFSTPNSQLSTFNSQLPTQTPLRLGLRLNQPDLTGDSRIGIRPQEFAEAVAIAQQAGLKISGLHFYRGTGTNATSAFTQVMDDVLEIAQQLPDWEYLDFGGGFGYPYHPGGPSFNWAEFGRALTDRLNCLNRSIELVIEPGRAAIAGCATLLTQVVSVKWQDSKQILGTDTTVANLSVPSVHGGYREIGTWAGEQGSRGAEEQRVREILDPLTTVRLNAHVEANNQPLTTNNLTPLPSPLSPLTVATDICGNTTYSRDYLGRNCQLPALQIGDILAIRDVGAYGYAMSSHFLHRPRPAEVLLENGSHRLIRKREDYSILLQNQVL